MQSKEYFVFLLELYLNNSISETQKQVFYEMLKTNDYDDLLSSDILARIHQEEPDTQMDLPKEISNQLFDAIVKKDLPNESLPKYKRLTRYVGGIAAVLALLFGGWLFFKSELDSTDKHLTTLTANYLEYYNESDTIQQLVLHDQSVVSIYPKSTLKYPLQFVEKTRSVSLVGKAFFEITKDAAHPFIVNSEKIVVRVLGTSFLVNAAMQDGAEEVEVRSGRVQVQKKETENQLDKNPIILTPNQKVVFTASDSRLTKSLVELPLPLLETEHENPTAVNRYSFNYNGQKLNAIFKELEKAYGVNIIVNNSALEGCVFTGNLAGEDLFTKLQILNIATRTSYKTQGTDIIIEGKGCIN